MASKTKQKKKQKKKAEKENKAPGRPEGSSLMTPERVEKILLFIRSGNSLKTSARMAGISYDTLNYWMNKGKEE
jgi:DNA invertase Pin-like site-specific DNA recombinase